MTCIIEEQKTEAAERYPNRYTAVPPNGEICVFTGLKHAKCYQLLNGIAKGKVRVVNLREPGAARGKTLFHVGDMLRFLDELAAKQKTVEAA
jgi:hypothetical protein